MRGKDLSIYPIDLGTVLGVDKSIFTLRQNQGEKMDAPIIGWVILGGEKEIIVDTGPCDPDFAQKFHRPIRKDPAQEIDTALGKIGLSPEEIDIVILTHLHWDHCFNLEYFPRSTFIVQEKELQYAVAPLPEDRIAYEVGISEEIRPPWMEVFGRIKTVNGDQTIIPGVQVISLPGHTPGSQGVVVGSDTDPWIIAGDTIPLFENWDKDDISKRTPGGIYQDLFLYDATLQKLGSFGGNVLPSHDIKVFEHAVFQ